MCVQLAPTKPKVTKLGAKPKLEKGPFSDKRMPGMSGFLFPGADASVVSESAGPATDGWMDGETYAHSFLRV